MIREGLTLSNYTIDCVRQSQIDPDTTIHTYGRMRCPACKAIGPTPGHGQTLFCEKCGLQMTVHGNCLTCEKEST